MPLASVAPAADGQVGRGDDFAFIGDALGTQLAGIAAGLEAAGQEVAHLVIGALIKLVAATERGQLGEPAGKLWRGRLELGAMDADSSAWRLTSKGKKRDC